MMSYDEAVAYYKSEDWKNLTSLEIVKLQLFEDMVCVDWSTFCVAMNEVFGRPVYTYEYADAEALRAEFKTLTNL